MAPQRPPLSLHAWLRFDAIQRLLPADGTSLLEIGAGLGSVGALLARRYRYVGLEPSPPSRKIAIERIGDAGVVLPDTAETYASNEGFDLVGAFEVLEHIEDDRAALAGWLRHVRRGGWLLVSVPAGRDRFGPTDLKAGHVRRYDRSDLAEILTGVGLDEVTVVAYGFPLGYALEWARNVYVRGTVDDASPEDRTDASGRWLQPPPWAAMPMELASAPFRYFQRPFHATRLGTGFVARGRRFS